MINGIPAPLANPIKTEPISVPAQPPKIASRRYPIRKKTGARKKKTKKVN